MTQQSDDETVAQTLHTSRSVSVFQIPPRGASGFHSGEWRVADKIHEGRLRVLSRGELCEIHLEDPSGQLFAMCPVPYGMRQACVEPAIDSSRYLVLRVEDPITKRHAFLGMGFNDRSESFDFTEALLRHEKNVERERAVKGMQQTDSETVKHDPVGGFSSMHLGEKMANQEVQALYTHHGDLSLQQGQTMRIHLKKPPGKESSAPAGGGLISGASHNLKMLVPLGPSPPPGSFNVTTVVPTLPAAAAPATSASYPAATSSSAASTSEPFDPFQALATVGAPPPASASNGVSTSEAFYPFLTSGAPPLTYAPVAAAAARATAGPQLAPVPPSSAAMAPAAAESGEKMADWVTFD